MRVTPPRGSVRSSKLPCAVDSNRSRAPSASRACTRWPAASLTMVVVLPSGSVTLLVVPGGAVALGGGLPRGAGPAVGGAGGVVAVPPPGAVRLGDGQGQPGGVGLDPGDPAEGVGHRVDGAGEGIVGVGSRGAGRVD